MTSYEYFKRGGAKEMPFTQLPKGYGWVTSCGGDGWYWNFFATDEQLIKDYGKGIDATKVIMCKIKRL